jgi:hypothetical protein
MHVHIHVFMESLTLCSPQSPFSELPLILAWGSVLLPYVSEAGKRVFSTPANLTFTAPRGTSDCIPPPGVKSIYLCHQGSWLPFRGSEQRKHCILRGSWQRGGGCSYSGTLSLLIDKREKIVPFWNFISEFKLAGEKRKRKGRIWGLTIIYQLLWSCPLRSQLRDFPGWCKTQPTASLWVGLLRNFCKSSWDST